MAAWQVLAGSKPDRLTVMVDSTPRIGFEIDIYVNSNEPYLQVKALDFCDHIIGMSRFTHLD